MVGLHLFLMSIPYFRPEAFELLGPNEMFPHGIGIQPFGILVASGVLVGAWIATKRAEREGLHPRVMSELAGYVLLSGFVFGHVLDALFYHWDEVVRRPFFLLEIWNGLSSFGGFIGAVVGGAVWWVRRRYSLIAFLDPIAYAFPFGWIFGRTGCFMVHDHPGRITDFPLAVADYRIPGELVHHTRHDLGLYEVFWCIAVIPLFLWLGRRRRRRGFYLVLLPLLYAPVRFGLDFLRATDISYADSRYAGLTPGHYGAFLALAAGLAMVYRVFFRPEPDVPGDAQWPPPARLEPEPPESTEEE